MSTSQRLSSFSIINIAVSIILICVFLILAPINRGFAFFALFLLVNIILSLVLWLIAESAKEEVFSDLSGWLKKQWNLMLGRDERVSYD